MLVSALLLAAYLWLAGREFGAAYFSGRPDLASLQRAVRWQPGNADYRHRLGRYFFLVQRSPEAAVRVLPRRRCAESTSGPLLVRSGGGLSAAGRYRISRKQPWSAAWWPIPTTPDLAWEAGNFYLVQGETDKALREFRVVMESDPSLTPAALKLCWRVKPDMDALLRDVVPPNADSLRQFSGFPHLPKGDRGGRQSLDAAGRNCASPWPGPLAFTYIRYLVGQHEVDQARLVWQQAATLCGLSAYQPSPENLVVNGDFSLNVLNGGFDWQYHQSKEVSLALDPTQSHGGHRSLLITFDARTIDDAGIGQLVPVKPSTGL